MLRRKDAGSVRPQPVDASRVAPMATRGQEVRTEEENVGWFVMVTDVSRRDGTRKMDDLMRFTAVDV
jgi:hypothetical protein